MTITGVRVTSRASAILVNATRDVSIIRIGRGNIRHATCFSTSRMSISTAGNEFNYKYDKNMPDFHVSGIQTRLQSSSAPVSFWNDQEYFSSVSSSTTYSDSTDSADSKLNFDMSELQSLASKPATPVSLSDMFKYASANIKSRNYAAQRLRNAQFLHRELPIRIAQRAVDLLTLPYDLSRTKQVMDIASIYIEYLRQFREFPVPRDDRSESKFTDMLRPMVLDRTSIPAAINQGILDLGDEWKDQIDLKATIAMDKALYRFFCARTGLRLMTEHHILSEDRGGYFTNVANKNNTPSSSRDFLGCIQDDCNPFAEVSAVADQVVADCLEQYGFAPKVEILDCTPDSLRGGKFTYVPHHLRYMVGELLKNSCLSTVRRFMEGRVAREDRCSSSTTLTVNEDASLPPIRVVVVKGEEDVTVKIADKGGGVPRSVLDKMWSFTHSSKIRPEENRDNEKDYENNDLMLRKDLEFVDANVRGFGLPLARIYARYFGGELTLKSMEGYGVDAYLYLPRLGESCENLTERVLRSPAGRDSIEDANYDTSLPFNNKEHSIEQSEDLQKKEEGSEEVRPTETGGVTPWWVNRTEGRSASKKAPDFAL